MYKKISSSILFVFCLFFLSNVQAGSFDYLESVYHLLLRSKAGSGLSIVKTGTGTGIVTSSATIDCGTVCNEVFTEPTVVTLTATPTAGSFFSGGSYFSGWSGGGCTGLDSTCVVQVDKNSSITVTAEFSLLPTSSIAESEPNNTYDTADGVPFNAPILGSIDATSDTDWFAFNATGENTVTIQFDFPDSTVNDSNDWHVQLFSSNNVSTPLRDVYVNKGDSFNLDTTGDITYYLVVSKDVSNIITDYEVTIITGNSDPAETEVPITGTDDHLNATVLPFDTVMHGNLTDIDNDQDWYKLQTAGNTITTQIEFSAPYSTSKDWVVTVYADNAGALGQMLARTAVTDGSLCYVTLPNTSSIFYVMVTDLTDIGNKFDGRPYTLTVHTGVGNVTGESEPNNDSAHATSVNFNSASLSGQLALSNTPGTLDVVSDTDWFTFKATSTTMDFILTSPETGNAAWTLSILETGDTASLGDGQSISVGSLTVGNFYHLKVVREVTSDLILVSAQYVITKQ